MKCKLGIISFVLICFIFFLLGLIVSEHRNQDLQKYRPLENVLKEMAEKDYDIDNYNCINFSKDANEKLIYQGINSSIIIGENDNKEYTHAFLGIWIDPQTGNYVTDYTFKDVYEN